MTRHCNTPRPLLLAVAAFLCGALSAFPFTAPAARAADEPGKVKKSELHEHMETIEESIKKLRRTIRKPESSAETLQLIGRIEQEALACKEMVPSRAGTLPEAERAKFVASYRKDMAAFIGQVLQMEAAVLDGDADKAQGIYKELKTREDDGHDKYMQPDEKEKGKGEKAEKADPK